MFIGDDTGLDGGETAQGSLRFLLKIVCNKSGEEQGPFVFFSQLRLQVQKVRKTACQVCNPLGRNL